MFENDDKEERYETFGYKDEDEINVSQSYKNRLLQKKRLERKQRKGNIWLARLHVLLRLIILSGLIYCLYNVVKLPQWYVDDTIFTTTSPNLEILNNKIVPTHKILNELRKITVTNEPIYKFEIDKIRINLLELEPIEDIYIRRYWFPARLKIIVKERVPVLSIYTSENSPAAAFFTKDGVLIGQDYLPLPEDIKTTKVLTAGNFREWDKIKINSINKIVEYIEQISSEKVEYIDLRNQNDIFVKIPSSKLRIGGLDEGVQDRVSRLASIMPKLKEITKPINYIDLRWKSAAYIKTE